MIKEYKTLPVRKKKIKSKQMLSEYREIVVFQHFVFFVFFFELSIFLEISPLQLDNRLLPVEYSKHNQMSLPWNLFNIFNFCGFIKSILT